MVCFGTFSLSAKEVGLRNSRTSEMKERIDGFQLENRGKRVAEPVFTTIETAVTLSMRWLCPEFL
jgi:hypothetical protein